jgi:hypothetical protein
MGVLVDVLAKFVKGETAEQRLANARELLKLSRFLVVSLSFLLYGLVQSGKLHF